MGYTEQICADWACSASELPNFYGKDKIKVIVQLMSNFYA